MSQQQKASFGEEKSKANVAVGFMWNDGPWGISFNPLRQNLTLEQAKALLGRTIRGNRVTHYRVFA